MRISTPDKRFTREWKMLFGKYRVFPNGRILSLYYNGNLRKKPLIMMGTDSDHYKINHLFLHDEHGNSFTIARSKIVANLFVPNPYGYHYIGHKDGNKCNYNADNLYWMPTPFVTEDDKRKIIDANRIYVYEISNGTINVITHTLLEACRVVKATQKTIYKAWDLGDTVNGFSIHRYEKGSEEYSYLCKLLQSDSKERHKQSV